MSIHSRSFLGHKTKLPNIHQSTVLFPNILNEKYRPRQTHQETGFKLKYVASIDSSTDIPKCGGGFQMRLLQNISRSPHIHNMAVFLMRSSSLFYIKLLVVRL